MDRDMAGNGWMVTDECIGCGLCAEIAPDHFELRDIQAVIIRQPESDDEIDLVAQASEECPVNAIMEDDELDEDD